MSRFPLLVAVIFLAVILELSIAPYLSVADATLSLVGILAAGLFLLGFIDLSLQAALLGGVLLDLAGPSPFGRNTLVLCVLWGFFFLISRYRLIAPRAVVVSIVMAATGAILTIPDLLTAPTFLLPIGSALLHAIFGTVAFLLIKKLFPSPEVVRL